MNNDNFPQDPTPTSGDTPDAPDISIPNFNDTESTAPDFGGSSDSTTPDFTSSASDSNFESPDISAPIDTDPITFTPDPVPVTPKKKSKLPLIIGAIIGALVIGGGVFGLLWYTNFTKPETVALDAMTNLFKTENIQAEGSIKIDFNEDNEYDITGIKLDLNASTSILPTSTNSTLTFLIGEDDEISVGIGGVILDDGSIYLQVEGLTDVIGASLPESLSAIVSYFEDELSDIEGQWYELNFAEIAFALGSTVKTSDYDCFTNGLNSLNATSARDALVDSYKANPFVIATPIDITRADSGSYEVEIDSAKASAFAATLYDNGTFSEFDRCGLSDLNDYDIFSGSKNDPALILYISTWTHEITGLELSYAGDIFSLSADLSFSTPKELNIETPKDAKSSSDLIDTVVIKFAQMTAALEAAANPPAPEIPDISEDSEAIVEGEGIATPENPEVTAPEAPIEHSIDPAAPAQ